MGGREGQGAGGRWQAARQSGQGSQPHLQPAVEHSKQGHQYVGQQRHAQPEQQAPAPGRLHDSAACGGGATEEEWAAAAAAAAGVTAGRGSPCRLAASVSANPLMFRHLQNCCTGRQRPAHLQPRALRAARALQAAFRGTACYTDLNVSAQARLWADMHGAPSGRPPPPAAMRAQCSCRQGVVAVHAKQAPCYGLVVAA